MGVGILFPTRLMKYIHTWPPYCERNQLVGRPHPVLLRDDELLFFAERPQTQDPLSARSTGYIRSLSRQGMHTSIAFGCHQPLSSRHFTNNAERALLARSRDTSYSYYIFHGFAKQFRVLSVAEIDIAF